MTKDGYGKLTASVRQRLLNFARQQGEDYSLVLIRYAAERLLYRLTKSRDNARFVLKGAMLFNVWRGRLHRPTQDLDLLGYMDNSVGSIRDFFKKVCTVEVEDDGLFFDPESVTAEEIREDQEYGGVRVKLMTMLGKARISLQIDIGFGDVITPPAQETDYPTLLGFAAPRIHIYPKETVVAEKTQAIVALGINNSRMKDFFDLWIFQRDFQFEGRTLAEALQATFERRKTQIPSAAHSAMIIEFAKDSAKVSQWEAFLKRNKLNIGERAFLQIIEDLNIFLIPPLSAVAKQEKFAKNWPAGGPWR